jgi:hypothetical protein
MDLTDALSPPSTHHKRSVGSSPSLSPSSPSSRLSRLQCPLCRQRLSLPPPPPSSLSSQSAASPSPSPAPSPSPSRLSGSSHRWRRHRPPSKICVHSSHSLPRLLVRKSPLLLVGKVYWVGVGGKSTGTAFPPISPASGKSNVILYTILS